MQQLSAPGEGRIIRIASRGDGVTADGLHVAGAAPGDLVNADGEVVERGPHHASPPCRHYGRCGGCQLQHVDDAAYRAFISDRIRHALAQQGISAPDMEEPHLSPAGCRRRASLRVQKRQGRVVLGFNEGESHRLVDIAECPVLDPVLFALVEPLRKLSSRLFAERSAGGITLTRCDQGVDVLIGPVTADGLGALEAMTDFAVKHGLARLSVDRGYGAELVHMPDAPTISFDGIPVALPPSAFLQATVDGERALVSAVQRSVAGARRIADLFAGLGTFSLPLSRQAHVTAVDAAGNAMEALQQAANRFQRPVTARHRDLFRTPLDMKELQPFDAVVVDPPRAGARAQVEMIARSAVPRAVMVSCNPNSFARDAKALVDAGFRLERLWPVGQFRWSIHVELVASFER